MDMLMEICVARLRFHRH